MSDTSRITFTGLGGEVTGRLREDILAGRYRDGDHLTERDLAEKFGLSRGPIRDALRQLQGEGLVHLIPRRGARVATLSKTDAAHVIEIRQALEPVAVRFLLAHRDPGHLAALNDILREMDKASRDDDWAALVTIDMEFHETIFRLAGSPLLMRTWEGLRVPLLQTFRMHRQFYESGAQVYRTHRQFFDALASGDLGRAEQSAREHVVDLRDDLLEHLDHT
ncbi:GntR family transcriptional regulator [Nonomuraea sp. SBT364]|uniref:GntR family transcriptional regulator n=1 Tax=Nonomuraea sp. SBT364 TaxID=1580530 RepID=UPI00066A7E9D|nr:GntR family transcriptional regulator [Nonomuraea sp. SBT364]